MPAPSPTATIANGAALDASDPWADIYNAREWANGGYGNLEGDFDNVKFLHFPRPQMFGFPRNAMLAETQDIYSQAEVAVVGPGGDSEVRHRQIIYADCLDTRFHRVRVAGCIQRFRMPKFGRVHIECGISHRCWPYDVRYGGASPDPVGYFSLWYGPVTSNGSGAAPTEIVGSRRSTRRQFAGAASAALDPALQTANLQGFLTTKSTLNGDVDMVIFAGFTATAATFFQLANTVGVRNGSRVDVLNTAFMVRVWKNVLD